MIVSITNLIRVVRLTPTGRGAVASVLVEGAGAIDVVQSLVRSKSGKPLSEIFDNRLVVGNFISDTFNDVDGEEIVVRRINEQSVELHCHGGYAAVGMIEKTLSEMGCHIVAWQQWIAEKNTDSIASAALVALADAPTERTAGILLDQYQGALRRAFDTIDECIERKDFATARTMVDSLRSCTSLGLHLTKPWQVVLAGPPNAGKSSLINAMVGFNRSIVHHIPGTTRDIVTVTTAMDGWPVELCDTAGLHGKAEGIEQAGIALAQKRITDADLVVLVFDVQEKMSEADYSMLETFPNALVVYNKIDLRDDGSYFSKNLYSPNMVSEGAFLMDDKERRQSIYASAKIGAGIDELIKNISTRLVPFQPEPSAAVPFTLEQVERVLELCRLLG